MDREDALAAPGPRHAGVEVPALWSLNAEVAPMKSMATTTGATTSTRCMGILVWFLSFAALVTPSGWSRHR